MSSDGDDNPTISSSKQTRTTHDIVDNEDIVTQDRHVDNEEVGGVQGVTNDLMTRPEEKNAGQHVGTSPKKKELLLVHLGCVHAFFRECNDRIGFWGA